MVVKKQVLIIGGGLAGLAAAVALASEEIQVELLERKPFLGGRASSYPTPAVGRPLLSAHGRDVDSAPWRDRQGHPRLPSEESPSLVVEEEYIDNCQHVLLKCCTNLIDFYDRLGVRQGITFSDRVAFLDEQGRLATLGGSPLPAPFHLLPSLLRFTVLGWKDKLAIAYAFFCLLIDRHQVEELDQVTMLHWLEQHRQTPRAIEVFWRTFLVSALNEQIEVASARYGLQVFLQGMLKHSEAFHIGVPTVPLSKLYTEPCLRFLSERGSTVKLRSAVARIEVEESRIRHITLSDGTKLAADYYLSSVPPHVLVRLLPDEVVERYDYFAKLRHLDATPITAVYLWFDRPITDLDYAALVGREIQWVFNKGADFAAGRRGNNQCLGLVVSASHKLLPLGRREIIDIALRDLGDVLPSARKAELTKSVVIKEPFATFSCRAGCDEFRPDQRSPLENFFVAGDWTRTGWPGTMESAVRSGYRSAELILEAEGAARPVVQPDMPTQGLVRGLSWFFRFWSASSHPRET
jgi:zeta-carotene desaturase